MSKPNVPKLECWRYTRKPNTAAYSETMPAKTATGP